MAISPETQRVLDDYALSVGGPQDPRYTNLMGVIQHAPSLEQALNKAARDGTLTQIRLDQAGLANAGMGGSYDADDKTITLKDTDSPERLVFILAHEIQHANHSRQKTQEYQQIYQDMQRVASDTRSSVHDYSPVIRQGLKQNREDEARAQIAGWNAYVEYQRNIDPGISEQKLLIENPYRASISFDGNSYDVGTRRRTQIIHPDLQFNRDLTLPATPANVEAMGRHFYDQSQGLGNHRNLNYQNYYADYYIEAAALAENAHRTAYRAANRGREVLVRIDMQSLGLDEQKMEAQGLTIPGRRLNYADASNPAQIIHSTLDGSDRADVRYNPLLEAGRQYIWQKPVHNPYAQQPDPCVETNGPFNGGFEPHATLSVLSEKVREAFPLLDGEQNIRLTAYWAHRCARERVAAEDIADIVREHRADGRYWGHAVSQDGRQIVTVDVDKALDTPVEQSLANLQQAQQEQAMSRQQHMQQLQNQQVGPVMRL